MNRNYENTKNIIKLMAQYPDRIALISGKTGLGKTWNTTHILEKEFPDWLYFAITPMLTTKELLKKIAFQMGGYIGNANQTFEFIINNIQSGGIVIDECDSINVSPRYLEVLRAFPDAGIPIIIIGTEQVNRMLQKARNQAVLDRFRRRIIVKYEYTLLSEEEITSIITRFMPAEDKVIERIMEKQKKENLGKILDRIRLCTKLSKNAKKNVIEINEWKQAGKYIL